MKYYKGHRKIGIVILHYVALEMTIMCIEQLIKTFKNCAEIVIVDNASNNGSGEILKEKYEEYDYIHVILNTKNEGFSKGNNIGYSYLKQNYDLDYIIISNNDVLIKQENFVELLDAIFNKQYFDVLGPDIVNPITRVHQNPSRLSGLNLEQIRKCISMYEFQDKHFKKTYVKMKMCDIRDKLLMKKYDSVGWQNSYENPVLHGACFIFSKKYIEERERAFDPQTFLYVEEDILHYVCKKNNYKMLYSPELVVEHLEDVSTNSIFKNEYAKRKMKNHQMMISYKVLLDYIEGC